MERQNVRMLLPIVLFLIQVLPVVSQEDQPLGRTALIMRRWANVRSRPTTSSTVIRRVYEGEEFPVLEERDEWVKIQLDETSVAWVFGELIQLIEEEKEQVERSAIALWVYVPVMLLIALGGTGSVYFWLARNQRILDYSGRLDRLTSAGYIENVSRDDVVRLTRAFGMNDRAARHVARQTYLDRYRVSSSHRKLTEKEKASFRKLQLVLQLGDAEVMRLMAKVYKGKGKREKRGAQ